MTRSFCGAARSAVSGLDLRGSLLYIVLEASFIHAKVVIKSSRLPSLVSLTQNVKQGQSRLQLFLLNM